MSTIQTKQNILSVARKLFVEKGYDNTSIRDIAGIAQVNVASIKYHFDSKEELFKFILSDILKDKKRKAEKIYEACNNDLSSFVKKIFLLYYKEKNQKNNLLFIFAINKNLLDIDSMKDKDGYISPPGLSFIEDILLKQNKDLSKKKIMWVINCIAGYIIYNIENLS